MTFEEAKRVAAEQVGKRPYFPGRLSGKIAVVTGGAQGFGFGIAQALIREGLDLDGAMAHYKERITYIVKRYLLTDFEVRGGWDEVLDAIRPYVEKYYQE